MHFPPLLCEDGSWTLFNESVGESYHAPWGAALEAREKFVAPCDIERLASKGSVTILDVCYGLGYNTAAALDAVWRSNPSCDVRVIGLEIDEAVVRDYAAIPFPFAHKELFDRLSRQFDAHRGAFVLEEDGVSITILIGDARERIREANAQADIVFLHPFSSGKQPELWTLSFFKDIRSRCADGAVLVTYSCARAVRERLAQAGFSVEDGPIIGRRGPATVARAAKHS